MTPTTIQDEVDIDFVALYYSYVRATDHRLKTRITETHDTGFVTSNAPANTTPPRRNHGSVVAASTDSDILFRGVNQLLRKDPRNYTFTSYDVQEILDKLELTRSQWTVAATTTNNDYTAQVKSQSFAKNVEIVRASDAGDPAGVLEQYCTVMNVDSGRYGPAKDIFMNKTETIMTESTGNVAIDLAMCGLVDRVNICFRRLKALQRADKGAAVATTGGTGEASNSNYMDETGITTRVTTLLEPPTASSSAKDGH
ncbi:hypothetical protein B0O80DRAFT_527599 [Mortierella sp. GBAus27b]|nr:hypothetical protein B0O80DRAFT_527599 [Mortierella sp. GBAus27b]